MNELPGQRSGVILDFRENASRRRLERELKAEASALLSIRGPNPYSDFILKNGARPERNQAATIGRLMNIQVRALDGSLQPPQKKKKNSRKENRSFQEDRYIDDILRLRSALISLAQNESDPALAIRYIDPKFGDVSVIREHLSRAVLWINQFAEEWDREQRTHGGQGPI
jgi:hypothetical protein